MDDALIDITAMTLYEISTIHGKGLPGWADLDETSAKIWRNRAINMIASVRVCDAIQSFHVSAATPVSIPDPDDYRHPLSLTGGPKHQKTGITRG